jgi:hypothetical protein
MCMNKPMRGREQASAKPTSHSTNPTVRLWRQLTKEPDLQMILAFCLIGFLLALNLMLRFPDFGAIIEQYNQF